LYDPGCPATCWVIPRATRAATRSRIQSIVFMKRRHATDLSSILSVILFSR
jgi:hypothetical protein